MIEIAFYAPGLREGDNVMNLGHSLELFGDGIHYHVDTLHDIVYFDMERAVATVEQIKGAFRSIGLHPRPVGKVPDALTPQAPAPSI